ncbi:hypothetical protein AGMMS50230_12910 [Spirochaetia bacterium]|nr:hypothetical protein AGMMS50230_12910 [Spirochaetia bacterium]
MDISEIQDELLRLEYPNLLPDHDPDIERYYYLRSTGQSRDAMVLYQNRLKVRYPDDDFRTWLLRSYRSHDPAFRGLLAKGYRMLGARSLERVKQILLIIAGLAESFNEKDVYSTIKTAEDILKFLSPERYEAVAGMERFFRYASALDLKVKSIGKATELVRAYLTDTLSVVEEERRRRIEAQRKMEDAEMQRLVKADWDSYRYQKKYGHGPFIDLSAVVFSPADLARIEIPDFSRVEDQILAYCIKYWAMVNDPAFERILFLYSRKYGKKNYDVYMAIRRGQEAKHRDDEILASIMSVLVTGYYYSIQGDLYLQRSWNAIKHALANQPKALSAPASKTPKQITAKSESKERAAKSAPRQIETKARQETKSRQPKAASAKIPSAAKKTQKQKTPAKPAKPRPAARQNLPRIAPKPLPKTAPKIAPKRQVPKTRPTAVVARSSQQLKTAEPVKAVQTTKPVKVPYKLKPAQETKTTIVTKAFPPPRPVAVPAAPPKPAAAAPKPAALIRPAAAPIAPPRPAVAAPKPAVMPPKPVTAPKPAPKPAVPKPLASAPPVQKGYRPAPFVSASPPPARPKQRVFNNKTLGKAKGSVSDRLKELSGRSYDVYEDRFLAKARNAIRKTLGTGKGLFFNLPEEAEDLVYNFLRDHYSDPYMDWEDSADRKNLLTMGFDLPSLHPVIDECYRTL